jgi:hypothetical protein
MLAQLHQGEAVIPAAFNPERYSKASGNDALVSMIKELLAEVQRLRRDNSAENNSIVKHTLKSAKIADKWDADGLPLERA